MNPIEFEAIRNAAQGPMLRVDHVEDAMSHFYNVINELRRRVSTLEKKSKPLSKRSLH
jgi:hypothetical protein